MADSPRKRRRIVVGVHEIGNNIATIAAALRGAGYDVTTVVDARSLTGRWAPEAYDRVVPIDRRGGRPRFLVAMALQLLRLARSHDTFLFVWNTSFLPFQLDYFLLRLLRKDLFVLYCGDDIRYRPVQMEIDRGLTKLVPYPVGDPVRVARYLEGGVGFWQAFWSTKVAEKLGVGIMAARDTATFQGRDYFVSRIPQPKLADAPHRAGEPPLLVHAPTDVVVKGTEHVTAAVDLLRERGLDFRFELINGISNAELIELMQSADIVIDQPGTWVSRIALEGMASGLVVLGGNQPDYAGWPHGTSVVQFEPDGGRLAEALTPLIVDSARRSREMAASYDCWKQTFSYEAFARFFAAVLDGSASRLRPLPDQKQTVLRHTSGRARRVAIKLFW